LSACQALRLQAKRRPGATEGRTVSPESEKSDGARPVAAHFGGQPAAAGDQLVRRQLVRGRGAAVHQIRQAVAELEQSAGLRRIEAPRREAGGVQGGPEAITGTGEVKTGRGGIETRVDAAEQNLEPRADDVAQALAGGGLQPGLIGPA